MRTRSAATVHVALAALAERPGYVGGHVGRNVDDPDLWVLTTSWANVGSYRRALSAYDVKVARRPAAQPGRRRAVGLRDRRAGAELNVQVPRELA